MFTRISPESVPTFVVAMDEIPFPGHSLNSCIAMEYEVLSPEAFNLLCEQYVAEQVDELTESIDMPELRPVVLVLEKITTLISNAQIEEARDIALLISKGICTALEEYTGPLNQKLNFMYSLWKSCSSALDEMED
jgi:hypothetical protein